MSDAKCEMRENISMHKMHKKFQKKEAEETEEELKHGTFPLGLHHVRVDSNFKLHCRMLLNLN